MFLFSRRSRLLAPTRARFDSPGRLALGWAEGMNEKPQRGEIPAFKPRRRAPGISPLWGWAVLCTTLPRVTNSLRIGAPPWAVESRPIRGWLIVCGNKTGIHSDEPNGGVLRTQALPGNAMPSRLRLACRIVPSLKRFARQSLARSAFPG